LPDNKAIAVYTPQPPHIDGRVDKIWLNAPVHNGFTQREPYPGQKATNDTRFYILFDHSHIYLLFVMLDKDPASIPARLVDRDHDLNPDDHICFYLDTYNDQRKAYFFSTNPSGVEKDGLISENGRNLDITWDSIYKVSSMINNYGWIAEFAIPYTSMRFTDDPKYQVWGFNVWRVRRKNREISYWSLVDRDYQMIRLDKGGAVIGIRDIQGGHDLNVLPYLTARNIETVDTKTDRDLELGLDLKYGLTSDLTLDATLNPDFGQVEIDEEQINLDKRYEIQLPEKRPFFLENTNLFQSPLFQLFYSRRIGIESELKAGAKLTGKIGASSVGVLSAYTGDWKNLGLGDPNIQPTEELFSVFRWQRDIFASSNIGAMYINRTTNIGGSNQEFDHVVDLDWSVHSGQKFFVGQGVFSQNKKSNEIVRGGAGYAQTGYYGKRYSFNIWGITYSPDFDINNTGFFQKIEGKGSSQIGIHTEIHPFLNRKFIRSWGAYLRPILIKDSDETETAWGVESMAWVELPDQSQLTAGYTRYRDVEVDKFSELFGFAAGGQLLYWGRDMFIEIQTDIGKPVSLRVRGRSNSQYYFQTHTIGYNRGVESFLHFKPVSNAFLEVGYQTNQFLDGDRNLMPIELVGETSTNILLLRARYLFNKFIFSRLFLQHTNGAEDFVYQGEKVQFPLRYEVWDRMSANLLFGWRFDLGSTIYLAYTEEWDKRNTIKFRSNNRILFLKISYLWSF
jgi:hypothetical protein